MKNYVEPTDKLLKLECQIDPIEYFDVDIEKIFTIKKHHKWLWYDFKIPPEKWNEFEELVKDPYLYKGHSNYCNYFYKDLETKQNELDENNDFCVKKMKLLDNRIVFLMKFKQLCQIKNNYDLMAKVGLNENDSKRWNKAYEVQFRCQRKNGFDLTQIKDCSRLIFNIYKQLFGSSSVGSKRDRVGGVSKQKYFMKKKYVDEQERIRQYKKEYNDRKKIYDKYLEKISSTCNIED
jgi:hypothetical protein